MSLIIGIYWFLSGVSLAEKKVWMEAQTVHTWILAPCKTVLCRPCRFNHSWTRCCDSPFGNKQLYQLTVKSLDISLMGCEFTQTCLLWYKVRQGDLTVIENEQTQLPDLYSPRLCSKCFSWLFQMLFRLPWHSGSRAIGYQWDSKGKGDHSEERKPFLQSLSEYFSGVAISNVRIHWGLVCC